MSYETLDCRGLVCPQPVIHTKNALEKTLPGDVLTVIVDNVPARENILKFAAASGCGTAAEEKDGCFYIRIAKDGSAQLAVEPPADQSPVVYLITHDTLGHGATELGTILIKSFFYTLTEQTPPAKILFLNSGVKLACEGSPVLDRLAALAARNVDIQSCGTCLDYYHLKEKLAVGSITNMYSIVQSLTAGRAVTL